LTINIVLSLPPGTEALITEQPPVSCAVVNEKPAEDVVDELAGTVTEDGTVASVGLLLASVTVIGVLCAPLITTVPEPPCPDVIGLGDSVTDWTNGAPKIAGVAINAAVAAQRRGCARTRIMVAPL
jgi:hypothetical protein